MEETRRVFYGGDEADEGYFFRSRSETQRVPRLPDAVNLVLFSYPHQNPGKVDFGFGLLANPDGFRDSEYTAALI